MAFIFGEHVDKPLREDRKLNSTRKKNSEGD